MTSSADALLAELDPLPYRARMGLLARRARELGEAGTLPRLLTELWKGDTDHRHIAVTMGTVARDEESVRAALRDPDPAIRRRGLRACRTIPLPAAELAALLDDASADFRNRVYGLIRSARMRELAERVIGTVRDRHGDREAAGLLATCGPETVSTLLPGLAHAVPSWTVLARHHPGQVLDEAERRLASPSRSERHAWWSHCGGGVIATAATEPERVFDLLERHPDLPFRLDVHRALTALARLDPERFARLLTDPRQATARHHGVRSGIMRRIARLDIDVLAALGRRFERPYQARILLKAVAPSRRAALVAAMSPQRDLRLMDHAVLDLLPHDLRIAEARRRLARPEVIEDEAQTLHYTAHLPFPEAVEPLTKATRRHQPEDRALAYEHLADCAVRSNDPAAVATVLAGLGRLRNEQDPVRSRVIRALTHIPARRFTAGDADALTRITTDAVEARDASFSTRTALGDLAVRLLAERSETAALLTWATGTLDRLFGTGRLPNLGSLPRVLRRGQERPFLDAVLPWLRAGTERARYEPVFAVAEALGRRAHALPELQDLLHRATDPGNVLPVIRRGVELWLADPATRTDRVEEVLLTDTSTVAIPIVWWTLSTDRTELIDLVLRGSPPAGRHLPEGVRWVPPHAPHIDRWLPRQRETYAALLTAIAADAGTQDHHRAAAIREAAAIPGHGRRLAEKYLDSPDVRLAEAALHALAHTDHGTGALPRLLAHTDGDRARVAAYSAGIAVRHLPPSQLRELLAGTVANSPKVTTRKEAARLLARYGGREAAGELLAAWRRDGQHRDVKVALVSAARTLLADPRAWEILHEAVRDAEPAIATAPLAVGSLTIAPEHRARYATLVTEVCAHPHRDAALAGWIAYPMWAPWAPDATGGIVAAVTDLDRRTVWRPAVGALIGLLDAGPYGDVVTTVLSALLDTESTGGQPDAEVDRDRPARRRIEHIVTSLERWCEDKPFGADLSAVTRAGNLLAAAPDHLSEGCRLLIAASPVRDGDPAPGLTAIAGLLAERPLAALEVAEALTERLRTTPAGNADRLWAAAEALRTRGDLAGGLLALAIARGETAGRGAGWRSTEPPWRSLLRDLRRHPEPEVRVEALDEATAAE